MYLMFLKNASAGDGNTSANAMKTTEHDARDAIVALRRRMHPATYTLFL